MLFSQLKLADPFLRLFQFMLAPMRFPGKIVRAYQMESQLAIYPRVIVDPDVLEIARQYRGAYHHPDDEEAYVRSGLAEDGDGQLWLDYISYESYDKAGGDLDAYASYLEGIGQLIHGGLQHALLSVVRKHVWLHALYVSQIELFSVAGFQADVEAEAQRLQVANLPTFAPEYAQALSRIAEQDAAGATAT
ncbi:hypothetical protein [Pararhizobium sp. A13]|uniref:hypothetical protein n=1 Tax=Pararhizobium sp. A13 TaxID=3133975 RepID=UPI0032548EB1